MPMASLRSTMTRLEPQPMSRISVESPVNSMMMLCRVRCQYCLQPHSAVEGAVVVVGGVDRITQPPHAQQRLQIHFDELQLLRVRPAVIPHLVFEGQLRDAPALGVNPQQNLFQHVVVASLDRHVFTASRDTCGSRWKDLCKVARGRARRFDSGSCSATGETIVISALPPGT